MVRFIHERIGIEAWVIHDAIDKVIDYISNAIPTTEPLIERSCLRLHSGFSWGLVLIVPDTKDSYSNTSSNATSDRLRTAAGILVGFLLRLGADHLREANPRTHRRVTARSDWRQRCDPRQGDFSRCELSCHLQRLR